MNIFGKKRRARKNDRSLIVVVDDGDPAEIGAIFKKQAKKYIEEIGDSDKLWVASFVWILLVNLFSRNQANIPVGSEV